MKKFVIVLACIVVFIIAAAFIIPVVFKDDIKARIDNTLAESLNADVVWDIDDFRLSLFRNFPNATASMNNFGVLNRAPFDGEILFAVQEFEVEVDIFSLFGDQIKINGIKLNRPEIFIKVLEDGTANYDITIESPETSETTTADTVATSFNIGIDHWEIVNGHLVYDDKSLPYRMELKNLQHSGSGDFTQDVFDLTTKTFSDSVSVSYDGVEYVSNKRLEADAVISISDEYGKYTFKENMVKVNEFTLSFDGFLALLSDGSMDMNITYNTEETSFKSLLSLVPGIYTKDFSTMETDGNLSFGGEVKGKYSEQTLPAFNIELLVSDAMFKYPDLPTGIDNIKVDLKIDNSNGVIENTRIDLKTFHMDFGQNPIDAKLLVENLSNYKMKADVRAKLNMEELSSMFPMEGTLLKGNLDLDIKADGVYDSIKEIIPAINAKMNLKNGYVKSSELPYALEDLHFESVIVNSSGLMNDLKAVINDFTMIMDGEPFKADLTFEDLNDYKWDLKAKGEIDLQKITKVFPLEGMSVEGKINADIETKGQMSDLEAERYQNLPTSGTVIVTNFKYTDVALPYGVTIANASTSFDPKSVTINNYTGTVGKSDMEISGTVSNYIAYMFGENEVLKGTMNFKSNLLDLNEFMTEEETGPDEITEESTPQEEYGIIEIPDNIDFTLKSDIKRAEIMDLVASNAKGDIIIRNGMANLSDLNFNMLEGSFNVNGTYDTRNPAEPKYDFKLGIKDLSIQKSFSAFSIIQQYAPIAEKVNGNLSTDFNIAGLLNQDMTPDMNSINAGGLLKIAQAAVSNSKILQGITNLTKLKDTPEQVSLKNVVMSMTIEEGKLKVKPFDFKIGDYKTTVSGATSLGGALSYNLTMDVPASKLGSQFNSLVSNYAGGATASPDSKIPLSIGIGGTYLDPKPTLLLDDQKDQVKEAVKEKAKEEVKDAAKDLAKKAVGDNAKDIVGGLLGGKDKQDTVQADSTSQSGDDLKKEAADKIKNLFKKKKKN